MLERKDVATGEIMEDYGSFAPAETASVPDTYYIPASEQAVLFKLADHGVLMERLEQEMTVDAEAFHIDSTTVAARMFQQHQERTLFGSYQPEKLTLPAGSFAVHTSQPLGRLIFYLLEPRSDDGLLNWNVLDGSIENTSVYPIRRSVTRAGQ